MSDDNMLYFCRKGCLDNRKNLITAQVSCCQYKIMFGNREEECFYFGKHIPLLINDMHRSASDPLVAQFLLQACPLRWLHAQRKGGMSRHFVDRIEGWHPYNTRTSSGRNLNRHGVNTTDGRIKRH